MRGEGQLGAGPLLPMEVGADPNPFRERDEE